MKRITDKDFRYAPSSVHSTPDYLREKFKRMMRDIEKAKQKTGNVTPIKKVAQ